MPKTDQPRYEQVALTACRPSKTNPRQTFEPKALAELTASIREQGVIEPLILRRIEGKAPGDTTFEIVAGERRWRAAKEAKLRTVPALIRELSDIQVLEIQLIENLQRKDLHELEEARGYDLLIKRHGVRKEDIARKVGKSRSYVYGRLKLLSLADSARDAFLSEKIPSSTALEIARIPVPALQAKATKEILEGGTHGEPMSFRAAKAHIFQSYMLRLAEALFALDDAGLVPKAGSCTACPKRSGNMPDLLAELKSPDVCTDPVCFGWKRDAMWKHKVEEARATGQEILADREAKRLWPKGGGMPAGGEFIDINAQYPGDPQRRSWRKLMGGKSPQAVLAKDPTGQWHELVPAAKARSLVKGRGHEFLAEASPRRGEASERRERSKLVKRVSAHALRVVWERAEKDGSGQAAIGVIALSLIDGAGDTAVEAAKARGLIGANAHSAEAAKRALRAFADSASEARLRALALDLALRERVEVDPGNYADALTVACGLYRVDLKELEKSVIRESGST